MASVSKADSRDMYSWWWDSHISPKNSKWLQENLTDMDAKVRMMIKLIEVDEDSFARRAEMYYKKRPELMKLVEEFYRAFRALAERYDHATGVIKQAHKTMAEAFPNQVPFVEHDDGSFHPVDGSYPRTPEMPVTGRAFCDPDDFHSGERSRTFESQEELNFPNLSEGKARKCLNFHDNADKEEVEVQMREGCPQNAQVLPEYGRIGRSEIDIQELKESLARLEAEKQAGLLHYLESFDRLSNLESEVSCAREDSRGFHERASKAEFDVQSLKESLAKLEGERESSLHQYQLCLGRISNLGGSVSRAINDAERLDKQASEAAREAQLFRQELVQLNVEKEVGLAKYMEALEQIANLQNKLLLAEDKAIMTSERAHKSEKEVAALTEALNRATEEKEAAALQCKQCLEKIASLESEIALSHELTAQLKDEIDQGAANLNFAEEQRLHLERSNISKQGELDSVLSKVGIQNQELSEKQEELGRLLTCLQEERSRFVEAETSLRKLQSLHSQTQEEMRSVAAELQKRVQLLKEADIHNQSLQDEVQKIADANKILNELNLSTSASTRSMEDEILNLKEGRNKLEGELKLQLKERNALQQELYSLREELNLLSQKHQIMIDQLEMVGFQPESFGSSVKVLQDENSKLKERCQSSESEASFLLEKLNVMEKLIEKKAALECSLSELSAELEDARGKVNALEKSSELLMDEKSTAIAEKGALISQLELTSKNLEKLSAKNTFLQNSLFDATGELEVLRRQSRNFEDSCRLLIHDKSILLEEKQSLDLKLETGHQKLEELEQKYYCLEQDQFEKAVDSQFEICVFRNIFHDLKDTNSSLLHKYEKLLEASKISEKLISELAYENIEQHEEANFLSEQIKKLRVGMFQLLKVLDIDLEHVYDNDLDEDQMLLRCILMKLDDTRKSLFKAWDENEKLVIEKSVLETLLGQFKQEVKDLKTLVNNLKEDFRIENDQLVYLQKDMLKLLQNQEELIVSVQEGNHKEEFLAAEVENLRSKLSGIIEEKRSLMNAVLCLDEEKRELEDENSCLVAQTVTLDSLSLIFKNIVLEGSEVMNQKEMEILEADAEICRILKEQEEIKRMMNSQCSEAELWETVAGSFFCELQTTSVREALFREKFSELMKEYKRLEDENCSKDFEVVRLRERVGQLEAESSEVKAQLAGYYPALVSLMDSVASLENHANLTDLQKDHHDEDSATSRNPSKDEPSTVASSNGFSTLQEVSLRIQSVESKVIQIKHLNEHNRSLRPLKSNSSRSRRPSFKSTRLFAPKSLEESPATKQQRKQASFPREIGELLVKDIVLDHASEKIRRGRHNNRESDDQILELWETMDMAGSIDLKVVKEHNRSDRSSESAIEKNVLEVSKRFARPSEDETNRKTVDRLKSDAQRLINLQITIQDLKHKVSITDTSRSVEHLSVKEEIEEADKAIAKLVDTNAKLMKNIEDGCRSLGSPSAVGGDSDGGGGSRRRRRASERVRRCSEQIGRLQLEVQKLQLILLKLDSGSRAARGGGTRVGERKTTVLLKDFLYTGGGGRTPRARKKAHFCGCAQQPRTAGD